MIRPETYLWRGALTCLCIVAMSAAMTMLFIRAAFQ